MNRRDIVNYANQLSGEEGHKEILNIYNNQNPLPRNYKVKYTDHWCATFVSAVFLKYNCNTFSECSCEQMINKAKKAGIWVENDAFKPDIGDVIMYDWEDNGIGDNTGTPNHTGIVISTTGNKITIREGNKNNTIGTRIINVNDKYIRGYICPRYEVNYVPDDIHKYKTITELVDGVINGDFGTGEDRKTNIYNYVQALVNDKINKP